MAKELPLILFAKMEDDTDPYIVATEEAADLVATGETIRVGKYQLVQSYDAKGGVELTPVKS
jgi:hypothetical protein